MKKKILMGFFLSFLAVSFLGAQSLAEMAKKEKERRAALKGKQTVVTNEDLGKLKRKAAMTESVPAEAVPAEGVAAGEAPATEAAAAGPGQAPAGGTPPAVQAPPEPAAEAAKEASANDQALGRQRAALEDKWNRAQELVDLLTMKMNALWQQFYSLDDMTAKESIQVQIGQTYDKLLKAQEEETAAREELNAFVSRAPREKTP
jgi:hypothetical protein